MAGLLNASCGTVSRESLASGTSSFHTAPSLFPGPETPIDTSNPRFEDTHDFRRHIVGRLRGFPDPPTPTESLQSGNSSFYSANSLFPSLGTPTDTSSPRSENMYDPRRPVSGSSRLRDSHSLIERSPRIIAVMGPTGAGKSTFIKAVTGVDDVRVGHSLRSCTEEIRAICCQHPSKDEDIVLVDTPGFDDTFKSDAQILEQIANWLKDRYQAGVKLSGILYLHRITDNRVTNTVLRNLDMFQKLCGSENLSSIILVTTHWDLLHAENIHEGKAHEEQLREQFWKTLLGEGSIMLPFENTCSSAWNIIDSLPEAAISLRIQREMVDEGKQLHDTAAGQSLSLWLQRASQFLQNMIQRLEHLLRSAVDSSKQNDTEAQRVEEDLREANEGLKVINKQELQLSRSRSIASSVARRMKRRKRKTAPLDQL